MSVRRKEKIRVYCILVDRFDRFCDKCYVNNVIIDLTKASKNLNDKVKKLLFT